MIPKIIHYCWFGVNELPELTKKCLVSWQHYFPDYEIIKWNESNSPMQLPYMQTALQHKNWANLSNLTRLHALKELGGIYFDTDVEVIRSFDFLPESQASCIVGIESRPGSNMIVVNNAVMLARKGDPFVATCLDRIIEKFDGTEKASLSSPILTTDTLKDIGFNGKPGWLVNIQIVPYDYFYPSSWNEPFDPSLVTKNTYCIHYNDGSWMSAKYITDDRFREIVKDLQFYKKGYKNMRNGKLGVKEMLSINFRFIKNLFFKK